MVLLGAPVNANSQHWGNIRSMVAWRFINGYSRRDLVLALVYRYERWKITVAVKFPKKYESNPKNKISNFSYYCL